MEDKLSNEAIKAAVQCLLSQAPALTATISDFASKEEFLKIIVENGTVLHLKQRGDGAEALYSRGVPTSTCTVVLRGQFKVETGDNKVQSESGPVSALAVTSLTGGADGAEFVPDYTVSLSSETAKCIQINRISFQAILRMFEPSHPEKTRNTLDALLHKAGPRRVNSRRLVHSMSQSMNGSITSPSPTSSQHYTDRKLFATSIRGRANSANATGNLVTVVSIDQNSLI